MRIDLQCLAFHNLDKQLLLNLSSLFDMIYLNSSWCNFSDCRQMMLHLRFYNSDYLIDLMVLLRSMERLPILWIGLHLISKLKLSVSTKANERNSKLITFENKVSNHNNYNVIFIALLKLTRIRCRMVWILDSWTRLPRIWCRWVVSKIVPCLSWLPITCVFVCDSGENPCFGELSFLRFCQCF